VRTDRVALCALQAYLAFGGFISLEDVERYLDNRMRMRTSAPTQRLASRPRDEVFVRALAWTGYQSAKAPAEAPAELQLTGRSVHSRSVHSRSASNRPLLRDALKRAVRQADQRVLVSMPDLGAAAPGAADSAAGEPATMRTSVPDASRFSAVVRQLVVGQPEASALGLVHLMKVDERALPRLITCTQRNGMHSSH
jgi:hypothetical protein